MLSGDERDLPDPVSRAHGTNLSVPAPSLHLGETVTALSYQGSSSTPFPSLPMRDFSLP